MTFPLLFLIGYDILSVDKKDSEAFINLCAVTGIVYRIIEFGEDRICARVTMSTSVRLRALCEKYGISAVVLRRRGIPALILKLFSRPGIVIGASLCAVMLLCSGRVIWDVRVEGNTSVATESIIDTLRMCGFGVGTKKEGLELDKIENHFLILSDEISWITVNVRGTVANVEVREAVTAQELPDYAASNLVAARNGTVVGFEEVKGNIAVEIGEAVSVGELLVGGVYGSEDTALRFVRSRGKVLAMCERDFFVSVPLKFEKKIYTGEQKIKKSLIFFEKEVKFFGNSGNSYTSCDTIDRVEYFNLFGLGDIPIGIRTVKYVEYELQTAERSEEQAAAEAQLELWQKFYADAPDAELVGKSLSGSLENGVYSLTATVKSIENIAVEREIEINVTG